MKYFLMMGSIDQTMLEKFIEFYNNSLNDEIRVIINSQGGGFYISEIIIEMINTHPNSSICILGAYSAGFMIALKTNCPKYLSKTCRGMWHWGKWNIEVNDKNKPYYAEDECIIRNLSFHKKDSGAIAKKVMTAQEYKIFLKDELVYFDFKRMKEIFPDAKIIK